MIRIKEDIDKIVREYRELEDTIVSTCKLMRLIKTEDDYCGFCYNEDTDMILVRVADEDSVLVNTKDYEFPVGCLFSNYMAVECGKKLRETA